MNTKIENEKIPIRSINDENKRWREPKKERERELFKVLEMEKRIA